MDIPEILPMPAAAIPKAEIVVGKPIVPERIRTEYELSRKSDENDGKKDERSS